MVRGIIGIGGKHTLKAIREISRALYLFIIFGQHGPLHPFGLSCELGQAHLESHSRNLEGPLFIIFGQHGLLHPFGLSRELVIIISCVIPLLSLQLVNLVCLRLLCHLDILQFIPCITVNQDSTQI